MAVVKLYEASVSRYVQSESTQSENGDMVEGEGSWSDATECEAVPSSGEAAEMTFDDGVTRRYSFTLYLHPNCDTFLIGDRVRLTRMGKKYALEVKGFIRYQHQAKVWVG